MPRSARKIGCSNIYHIILRGVNKRIIFESERDYAAFFQTLCFYRTECKYQILAFCLMDNHVHLLLHFDEDGDDISLSMKKIEDKFIWWYNKRHERCGHLFQERFKSEPVDDDTYLLRVFRYIHQNPLKAGIVNNLDEYKWSSFSDYKKNHSIYVNISFMQKFFSNHQDIISYLTQSNNDYCMENITVRQSDEYAISLIKEITQFSNIYEIDTLPLDLRNEYIHQFSCLGMSARQISRVTGISRKTISTILITPNN